jgi:hypothetical protein
MHTPQRLRSTLAYLRETGREAFIADTGEGFLQRGGVEGCEGLGAGTGCESYGFLGDGGIGGDVVHFGVC